MPSPRTAAGGKATLYGHSSKRITRLSFAFGVAKRDWGSRPWSGSTIYGQSVTRRGPPRDKCGTRMERLGSPAPDRGSDLRVCW
jgi:hypothetical protein